jgi:hypothetical protein
VNDSSAAVCRREVQFDHFGARGDGSVLITLLFVLKICPGVKARCLFYFERRSLASTGGYLSSHTQRTLFPLHVTVALLEMMCQDYIIISFLLATSGCTFSLGRSSGSCRAPAEYKAIALQRLLTHHFNISGVVKLDINAHGPTAIIIN